MSSDSIIVETRTLSEGAWSAASWWQRASQQVMQSLRAHSLFAAMVAVYVCVGWVLPLVTSVPVPFSPMLYSTNLLLLTATFLVVTAAAYVIYVMVLVRPPE